VIESPTEAIEWAGWVPGRPAAAAVPPLAKSAASTRARAIEADRRTNTSHFLPRDGARVARRARSDGTPKVPNVNSRGDGGPARSIFLPLQFVAGAGVLVARTAPTRSPTHGAAVSSGGRYS